MNHDWAQNKDDWDRIFRINFPETPQEGYTPVQGYIPAVAQNEVDSQNLTAAFQSTHQSKEANAYTIDNDENDEPKEEVRNSKSSRRQSKRKSQAKPLPEQAKSKRAELRERVADENNGEVSATNTPKGLVEWHEDVFCWWDPLD